MQQQERQLLKQTDKINNLLARYGVKFGIYKNGTFKEQLFPFDSIPRIIEHTEFEMLERGLKQRVLALNLFLKDIYSEKKIVKDGVVPEDFIFASSGYMAECEGVLPVKGVYSHISGIDLVKGKDGEWYILEDNLRVPSGASYPMIARDLCRKSSPETFHNTRLIDNRDYAKLLRRTILDEGELVPRKADLRAFVLMADEPYVWASGLTRFSRNPASFIVNSSQGGGFKDTWVLSQ